MSGMAKALLVLILVLICHAMTVGFGAGEPGAVVYLCRLTVL